MKKIWNFLQWQWQQFETWQKMWILAMFLVGAGTSAKEPVNMYLLGAGGAIIVGFMLKWVIWDGTRSAWARYNEEQEKIINIMKDGIK